MPTLSVYDFKEDFTSLGKNQIGEILELSSREIASTKKPELLEKLYEKVGTNDVLTKKIYNTYPSAFSLHPSFVEELLEITRTERLRWTEEEKLKVVEYDSFNKWGRTISYPKYDGYHTRQISSSKIEEWREAHQKTVGKTRKEAVKKSQVTRKQNESLHREFYDNEWKKVLASWYREDAELGVTLQLAYWTIWTSRWAKESQVKATRARTKKKTFEEQKERYYAMKNEALERLIKSPYAKIEFYRPYNPDKVISLEFCPTHYNQWCQEREFYYFPKWAFYEDNLKTIHKCKGCAVEISKDYYSLFYVSIGHEKIGDYSFSFHTPFPIGEVFFPNINELPRVEHEEQEGMFKFGRSLFDQEKAIFKTQDVDKHFKEATNKFDLYFK